MKPEELNYIISQLERNRAVFVQLLQNASEEEYRWRYHPEKWCLLEIICHLVDEEKEDFRTRLKLVLESPESNPPSINPVGWVSERNYMAQDYQVKVQEFANEREISFDWLKSLNSPPLQNEYPHPKLGPMSGNLYLSNWLAHDYMHIRQITRTQYYYLQHISGQDLQYAGTW